MNRNFIILIAVVNVLVLFFGGFVAYYDLYLRENDQRHHANTQVIEVEYFLLGYRPIYEYIEIANNQTVITRGHWTFDFFQLSICLIAIVDIDWIYYTRRRN